MRRRELAAIQYEARMNDGNGMEKIGKYEIIRTLGKGATAVVYLARDPDSGLEVATGAGTGVGATILTGVPARAAPAKDATTAATLMMFLVCMTITWLGY